MASLTGQLVAETYKALLKTIDNDILTASEKQITDGFGGGSNVFIDSQGFLRANKYKVTDGLATQFLKADGSLDYNAYAIDSNTVHLTGNETIYGFKTFATGANIQQLQIKEGAGFSQVSGYSQIATSGSYFHFNNGANTAYARFLYGTGQRIYTLPSTDGTIALISDIPSSTATWGAITGTLSNQTDLQSALDAKFDDPTGNSTQYIDGSGNLQTFPTMLSSDNLIKLVRNQSGATMTAGTIVYINGATGNKPTIAKALATSDATSAQTYGMVQADIANNADGYIVVIGNVNNLDTHSLTEGAQLYLSATTAGAWTTTKQYAPNHLVYVGIVLRSHPNQGIVGVKIQNGYEMDELHDVSAQTPSNNDGLFFETSTSLWKNKSIATILGYTPANNAAVVHNTGDETVNGRKTFTTQQTFNNSFLIKNTGSGSVPYGGWTTIWTSDDSFNISVGTSASTSKLVSFLYGSTNPQLTLPSADGTLALVSQLSNFVSGSGSTGYIPKWTSSSVIGSSLLYDDGTNIGYGTNVLNYGNYGRTFTGAGFGTASFGFESVSNSITNNALLGGLSFVIGTNDSSRRIGSAIQAYLLASTATNYGAELRFYAKADAGVLGEVARMTSAGLRVYGTIVKDGGTSGQFLKADGSIDSNTYLTTGSASSTYLPLTGGTLTGQLIISASGMGAQINGGTFTQGTASSYALGVANGGGFDLTLGTSSTAGIIQTWSSKPLSLNPQGNNVLIGTTTNSGYKFDVNGNGRFVGQLVADGGDFRSQSGGTAAIGVVLSSEYNVASNPKSVYTSYGQSTVLGGHEFRSVNGSGTGSITSAYGNPSGNWTFYYPATFTNSFSNTSDMQIIANGNISGINIRSTQGGRLSILQGYIAANVTSFMTSTGTNNPSIEAIRIANSSGAAIFSSSVTANQFISNASNVGDEYYFFRGNTAVNNNFTIYTYSNSVYLNGYSSLYLRANNTGGSGGTINLNDGNVLINNRLKIGSGSILNWGNPFYVTEYPYGSYSGGTTSGAWVGGNNNYYDGSNYRYVNSDYATLLTQGGGDFYIRTATTGTAGNVITWSEKFRVTNSGNVGVGLQNPQSQLQMNGTLTFSESGFDTARLHTITHAHSDGSSPNNWISFNLSNGSGVTNPIMRLNGAGMVGINTTSPGNARLYVNGNVRMGSAVSGIVRSFYAVQVGNNITFDVFRWLDDSGAVIGTGALSGTLYFTFYDTNTGGNQINYEYRILSCGNGTTNASITQVGYQLRGTQPITSVQIVNDGSGGGIKVIGTVVPSGVAGCIAWGTFVGNAIG